MFLYLCAGWSTSFSLTWMKYVRFQFHSKVHKSQTVTLKYFDSNTWWNDHESVSRHASTSALNFFSWLSLEHSTIYGTRTVMINFGIGKKYMALKTKHELKGHMGIETFLFETAVLALKKFHWNVSISMQICKSVSLLRPSNPFSMPKRWLWRSKTWGITSQVKSSI